MKSKTISPFIISAIACVFIGCSDDTSDTNKGKVSAQTAGVQSECSIDSPLLSRVMYESPSVISPNLCSSIMEEQTRTCSADTYSDWSGSFNYSSCAEAGSAPTHLLTSEALTYVGAFRFNTAKNEFGTADRAMGGLALAPDGESLYLVGKEGSVAEYEIPELVKSWNIEDLNTTELPTQPYANVLKAPKVSEQTVDADNDINRATGLSYIGDELYMNAAIYYDGGVIQVNTTFALEDPSDIAHSPLRGYFQLEGKVHASGWFSPIPLPFQSMLGGDYIAGHASNFPINARHSMGPSLFVFNSNDLKEATPNSVVNTTPLIDYDIHNLLAEDRFNETGTNDVWTEMSEAHYGLIVPGTASYLVVGNSGGHGKDGIGYKVVQSNGNLCGGGCAYDANDYYNYIWLYDVNQLESVLLNEKNPHEMKPYDYGVLETNFMDAHVDIPSKVSAAVYDANKNLLYVTLYNADRNGYEYSPICVVYSVNFE